MMMRRSAGTFLHSPMSFKITSLTSQCCDRLLSFLTSPAAGWCATRVGVHRLVCTVASLRPCGALTCGRADEPQEMSAEAIRH